MPKKTKPAEPELLTVPGSPPWQPQQIAHVRTLDLIPNPRNAKKHPAKQIEMLAGSIRSFGFVGVILIDRNQQIIAGHGRWEAAKKVGLDKVPCVVADHLTPAQCLALGLADNRLSELGEVDEDMLDAVLQDLDQQGFAIDDLGFDDTTLAKLAAEAPQREAEPPSWNLLVPCSSADDRAKVSATLTAAGINHHPVG